MSQLMEETKWLLEKPATAVFVTGMTGLLNFSFPLCSLYLIIAGVSNQIKYICPSHAKLLSLFVPHLIYRIWFIPAAVHL